MLFSAFCKRLLFWSFFLITPVLIYFSFLEVPTTFAMAYFYPGTDPYQEYQNTTVACYGGCGEVNLNDCTDYGGQSKDNVCQQNPWTFQYASKCWGCALGVGPDCSFEYLYSYSTCSTQDRCEGSNTGGSGYASNGHVLPGICDAGSYNGSNPNSACVSGGHYKQCCSSGGTYPTTYCSNGVCPAGEITPAGTTSCTASSTCDFNRTFNQCGAGANACANHPAAIDGSHTVKVDEFHDSGSGAVCKYDCTDLGQLAGQCNNPNKYKCSGSSCVLDNTNGTYTDSNCSGACASAYATLSSGCSGATPHLNTSWGNIGSSGTNNIYIQAGSCTYQVGTNNTGSNNNITNLGSCGSVVNGGIYHLYAMNSGSSLVAQAGDVTPSCTSTNPSPSPSPSAAPAGCNNTALSITNNPSTVGSSITFHYNPGQDTWIGTDTWSGGATGCNRDSNLLNRNYYCTAQSAVTNATWTHYWRINNNTTQCFKTANYTINAIVPPTPTISPMPACIANNYNGSGITISWASATPAVNYIDISTSNTFNTFYNKTVTGTSTPATGFGTNGGYWNGSNFSSNTLIFQPGTQYYVRSYNGSLNSNPPPGSFTTPAICLSASCSVAPTSTTVGSPATWTAVPLGGIASKTYAWSGTNSLSGASNPISKTYVTAGTKTGQVTVTSGTQTATANCSNSLTVTSPPCPGLLGNCDTTPPGNLAGRCAGSWDLNPGPSLAYNIWCTANANPARGYCYQCNTTISPWIQTTGDVHSNEGINAPGGP